MSDSDVMVTDIMPVAVPVTVAIALYCVIDAKASVLQFVYDTPADVIVGDALINTGKFIVCPLITAFVP